jgi:phosphatidylglycerol:prolipoprotein diacylglycerol transferase
VVGSGIVFEVGPLVVHWYGLLIVVGTLAGGFVATRLARRRGEAAEHVWYGLLWCLLLGFLGARLYHIISTPATGAGGFRDYLANPIAMLEVWDGGLGFWGGLAGGLFALLIYSHRHNLDSWRWLDIGAPGLALAQAIARWANLVNQELYGPPTRLPWGIPIDGEHRIPRYADLGAYPTVGTRFHPTFLYASLWNLAVFAVLAWMAWRWFARLRDGDIFLAYILLYSGGQLWIEQLLRPDAWRLSGGLAVGALISVVLLLVAGLTLRVRHAGAGSRVAPTRS